MNREFWKDKKVFITGHTGFKGAWLSLWLQDCGAILAGYALAPNTKPNMFEAALVANGMESIIGDVRDLDSLTRAMTGFAPDIVIHMAAQPLVRLSYKKPVETYSTNVMGTVNLFEAVRKKNGFGVIVKMSLWEDMIHIVIAKGAQN
jgi:CDP-glucose 4,6-dehydratase